MLDGRVLDAFEREKVGVKVLKRDSSRKIHVEQLNEVITIFKGC